jgi:hypothetical protein
MNALKKWLLDNYSHDELADIARGRTVILETKELYTKFAVSLHSVLEVHKDATGEYPKYVMEKVGNFQYFAGRIVWFATKTFAQEITGEYIEEEKIKEDITA